jgi:hypothetical protein
MDSSEFEESYEDIDWDLEVVNQYCIKLTLDGISIRIPTRNTVLGEMAYFPREETFDKKEQAIDIIKSKTDYIPNPTPNSDIKTEVEKEYIRITYSRYD